MRAQGLETRLHEVGDERTLGGGREDTGYVTKRRGDETEKKTRGTKRKDTGYETKRHGVRDENTRREDTGYETRRHGVRDERILVARAKGHGDQDGRTRDWGDRT